MNIYILIHVCLSNNLNVYIHIAYIHTWTYMDAYICMSKCVFMYIHTHKIGLCMSVHVYMYIYKYTCMHIYMPTYIYA